MYSIMESETFLYRDGTLLGLPKSQIRGEGEVYPPFDMWKLIKQSKSEVLSLFGQLLSVRFCDISLFSE